MTGTAVNKGTSVWWSPPLYVCLHSLPGHRCKTPSIQTVSCEVHMQYVWIYWKFLFFTTKCIKMHLMADFVQTRWRSLLHSSFKPPSQLDGREEKEKDWIWDGMVHILSLCLHLMQAIRKSFIDLCLTAKLGHTIMEKLRRSEVLQILRWEFRVRKVEKCQFVTVTNLQFLLRASDKAALWLENNSS